MNRSQAFSAVPVTKVAASKTRVTAIASYKIGDVTVGVQDNWLSSFSQATGAVTSTANVYTQPRIKAFNTVDANVEWNVPKIGDSFTAYLTVQNLFNTKAPLAAYAGSVGLTYPVPANYDIMGRYFTVGVRAKF